MGDRNVTANFQDGSRPKPIVEPHNRTVFNRRATSRLYQTSTLAEKYEYARRRETENSVEIDTAVRHRLSKLKTNPGMGAASSDPIVMDWRLDQVRDWRTQAARREQDIV